MKHNWEYKRVEELGKVITGSTPKTSKEEYYNSPDYMFVKPGDIAANGITELINSDTYISELAYKEICRQLPANSVLVTCIGIIGKVGILAKDASCNQQINAIIPDENCYSRYLAYALLSIKSILNSKKNGPVVPIINKSQFSSFKVPVPPMEVQKRIVAELDKINEVIEDCRELLRNLDALAQSLFYDYFGDPVTNPKDWDIRSIQRIAKTTAGGTPSKTHAEYYTDGNILWLRSGEVCKMNISNTELCITELGLQNSSAKLVPVNSVVVAMYGATAAQVGIIRTEMALNQAICAILPNKYTNPIFLYYCLSALKDSLLKIAHGAAQPNISQAIIRATQIPVPPLSLQEKFAARIEQIEAQKKTVEETIANLQLLLDSRMDYWFN